MGLATLCLTLRKDRIGHLPCNCSIGGPAKGHIAREVDALGGQMAVTSDHTLTHTRRVGTGKGPAVQTVRAQVCKKEYPQFMQEVLLAQPNLTVIECLAETILSRNGEVTGIAAVVEGQPVTFSGRSVVITTGTFLNGLCHEGHVKTVAAREGDRAVAGLSAFLVDLGIRIRRFKTGTTPRVKLSSLDLSQTLVLPSEPEAGPLSFIHDRPFPKRDLLPTWQTHTNASTHDLLRDNLGQSAMYGGQIEGVGPRYCPSIEDKVVRFADKDSHPIFLEQEEWDSESIYVQGFSSSMPAEVQLAALRTIPGLQNVEMIRPGYAVEYDMADPLQLRSSLMSKLLPGLYLAGQINGTSGYEEAAGQGIVVGINAAQRASGMPEITFPRDNSFIGVMIDDLVTKGVEDPYRMLTARAEHRLLLRHDNADQRLTPTAISLGLASESRMRRYAEKMERIESGRKFLAEAHFYEIHNPVLHRAELSPVKGKASFAELLRRPDVSLKLIENLAEQAGLEAFGIPQATQTDDYGSAEHTARQQLEIESVYAGYLKRQTEEAELARRLEELPIPIEYAYGSLNGLSYESREKLSRIQPTTVGQASRIPGVRPSDIALLIGYLRHR